jgi:predicted RNA-binding Zn-ribbon protein involved in translation (DUF1610 family)
MAEFRPSTTMQALRATGSHEQPVAAILEDVEVKKCPGARIKAAAVLTIERCLATQRAGKPAANCRLSLNVNNGQAHVTCACGAASIWRCSEETTARLLSLHCSMAMTDDAFTLIRSESCVMLLVPSMRNSTTTLEEQAHQHNMDANAEGLEYIAGMLAYYGTHIATRLLTE